MVFWIGILVGIVFAGFAVRKGFYETWTILFNILISVYLAISLREIIKNILPAADGSSYSDALAMLIIAIAVFAILHGIAYIFLLSQFKIDFPKIFDGIGSGTLGFLGGVLVWSFIVLMTSF